MPNYNLQLDNKINYKYFSDSLTKIGGKQNSFAPSRFIE